MEENQDLDFSTVQLLTANAMVRRLLARYECPLCYSTCRSSIHTCEAGHSVCFNCFCRVRNMCPTCRCCLGGLRHTLSEFVAKMMPYQCLNASAGCESVDLLPKITVHEKECKYRPCPCPYQVKACKWEGQMDSLIEHLRQKHPSVLKLHGRKGLLIATSAQLPSSLTWVALFRCYGDYFIINIHHSICESQPQLDVIVQLVGSEEDTGCYKFTSALKTAYKTLTS